MESFINKGIVDTSTSPSGESYGEKGMEQGDDAKTPSHPTPSPESSIDKFRVNK